MKRKKARRGSFQQFIELIRIVKAMPPEVQKAVLVLMEWHAAQSANQI